MEFSWQNGRQLGGMQLSDETAVSYQYNSDGIRIGKTVNDTEASYFVDASGTMQAMKQGDEELVFMYDATGRREGFIWYHEGQKQGTYYYLYNMQSDVIGMVAEDMSPVVTYEYDAWGKLLSVSGEKKDTVGKLNPFRYRGYVYEEENGLYYVTSRYYDPEVGRFLNADGYVSTGQGLFGNNMFGYCGNNPVNRFDPTGHFWSGVWNFIKTAVTEVGKAIGAISPVYAGCGGAAAIDGPLLIADAIALGIAAVCTIRAVSKGIYITAKTPSISRPKTKEREKAITIPRSPKKRAYFTVSPYDFTPKGLVMKEFPGTKNGRIIEWRDPISQAKIFEWNEDFRNGSHYHAMMIEWDGKHDGMHYVPGTPVPEPWNWIYFGD